MKNFTKDEKLDILYTLYWFDINKFWNNYMAALGGAELQAFCLVSVAGLIMDCRETTSLQPSTSSLDVGSPDEFGEALRCGWPTRSYIQENVAAAAGGTPMLDVSSNDFWNIKERTTLTDSVCHV